MPERFEQEPNLNDPEWYINELRTLSARWSEVDTKRPLSKVDLEAETPPVELSAPDEQELRQREIAIAQQLHTAVDRGMFNEEQKQRLIEALGEAVTSVDDDRVREQLSDTKHFLETGK